jgi:23S rRNA (cytosine1962-C5)-methyltransferase
VNRLTLQAGRDRRVRGGHPWIFSNEILGFDQEPTAGDAVEVASHSGEFLGVAYFNPQSLIAARILSRHKESIDTVDFFRRRIADALEYRHRLYGSGDSLRIVHGEGDRLPGLVVDRYGEVLSVQFLTLGMERRRNLVLEALQDVFRPAAIVARNDVAVRELEGLPCGVELIYGEIPAPLIITEHGLRLRVDVLGGQKTGHFLDQKENHQALQGRVEGSRVLDLFCYSGSWSLHAAHYGAAEVTGVDSSPGALALAEENVRLNSLETKCSFVRADVFELLRDLGRRGERYNTIILDPPAFVKSKKRLQEAIKGYLTINRRAMELLAPGGFLFSCTCSHHLDRETFLTTLRKAAAQATRTVRIVEIRGQSYDHPVLLNCPETEYLKCAVLQAL